MKHHKQTLDQRLYRFSICLIDERYVLLTGGSNRQLGGTRSSLCFKYDTLTDQWVNSPAQPSLNQARSFHGSCATSFAAFVFCGFLQDGNPTDSIETMVLIGADSGAWS